MESFLNAPPESAKPYEIALDEASWAIKFRHSGWMPIRRKIFDALRRTGQTESRISSFSACGVEAWLQVNNADPKKFRVKAGFCHDRLCTPCANTRAWRLRTASDANDREQGPHLHHAHVVRQGEGLSGLLDRLYKHFRALRQHPTWSETVKGGAAFLEIKWSDKAQRWHPHLHILCEAKYLPQQDLCDAWRSITKDSYIVDIRRVKDAEVSASYVTKYASKPLNMSFVHSAKLLDEAVVALKGRRLCLCFGTWFGTPLDFDDDVELCDDLDDAAGWTNVLPLETLMERAADADPEAIAMLTAAGLRQKWYAALNAGP